MSDGTGGRSPGFISPIDHTGETLAGGAVGGAAVGAAAAGMYHTRSGGNGEESGVQRGPSNASSQYSAAGRTEESSGDYYGTSPQDYYHEGQNYTSYTPYTPGAGGYGESTQPVIRDVSARRDTRIENPGSYQQGSTGISQNF